MIRYTPEQKAEAMARAQEVGVSKASKELNISPATFYAWKREASAGEGQAVKEKKPRRTKEKARGMVTDSRAAAHVLLSYDDGLAEKVVQLQKENADLREKNAKLKRALAALLDSVDNS